MPRSACWRPVTATSDAMPKKYEALRDKFIREGLTEKAAKGKAARIFNAQRKKGQKPVTRKSK